MEVRNIFFSQLLNHVANKTPLKYQYQLVT